MAYTSEQYKYLLVQRLRRHMAMYDDSARMYTLSFFGRLFDESVTVTEEAYNHFMELMDKEIQFCAENDIYYDEDITQEMIDEHGLLLTEAFAAVGIDLVLAKTEDGYGGTATFTKPNGEVMVYTVTCNGGLDYDSGTNRFRICSRASTEYAYAKASAKYYSMEDKEVIGLDEFNPFRAGPDLFWSYDADTTTMTITGTGSFVSAPTDTQIGAGPYSTLILGANVAGLAENSLTKLVSDLTTLVLLHAADAPLQLPTTLVDTTNRNVVYRNIYCDNEAFKSTANIPVNIGVIWHSLDEWDGSAGETPQPGMYYNGQYLPWFANAKDGSNGNFCIGVTSDGIYIVLSGVKTLAAGATTFTTGFTTTHWRYDGSTWGWIAKRFTSTSMTPIWANYDVCYEDGTVFLEASMPTTTP